MKTFIILGFLFSISSLLFAGEDAYITEYYANRPAFTDANAAGLAAYGRRSTVQDAINLHIFIPSNTNYYFISCSTQNAGENNVINNFITAGKVVMIRSYHLQDSTDPRTGETYPAVTDETKYNDVPLDWDIKWQ